MHDATVKRKNSMTFPRRRNRLTTHFSERIPVAKRRISVYSTASPKGAAATIITTCCYVIRSFVFTTLHHMDPSLSVGGRSEWSQCPTLHINYEFNPLNAELNPICHLLIFLGDLTFIGPCILSIFYYTYISNKMQRYTVYLYLETALHVSGGTSTHQQECIQLYL
jgi:hypothetical protein